MQFTPNGPDIPAELISLQEKGEAIFICGAGVSRTIGLPLFRGLVEGVYKYLGEDWNLHTAEREGMRSGGAMEGQYDRVLRCLERRLIGSDSPHNRGMRERIRAAVRHVLAPPADADLGNHLALLELSRDADGHIRILTTNFDTMFERAWLKRHNSPIPSHAGPAMPQPKGSGFEGVLHLHGRLADAEPQLGLSETDLVLTSAEFGEGYLRSGWASRYVYDLVRAYTVVLVGYQADDPPMRYLLEVLEADRERYPELKQVYAFVPCAPGQEEVTGELWRAKAVEPILYVADNEDHSRLYETIHEWRRYADDSTNWRRERVAGILAENPSTLSDARIQEAAALLSHGDASQVLGELSPSPEWLSVLVERRVLDRDRASPGEWIAKRVNDAEMIRACAALNSFDEQARWQISGAIDHQSGTLSPVRFKAWQLLLSSKRQAQPVYLDESWYLAVKIIRAGQVGFDARRLVSRIVRPQLKVRRHHFWRTESASSDVPESLADLLSMDFEPAASPNVSEILEAWPRVADRELELFRTLERALAESLEEASDVGYLEGWDRCSRDVPSVARHAQNAYRTGFYPITRILADLWERIASRDQSRARALALVWAASEYLLMRRLWLFALSDKTFAAAEVATHLQELDDRIFWDNGAQVEIMRLLTTRWGAFSNTDRAVLEKRLRGGVPRDLYPADAFENEDEWLSIQDSTIFRRLKRIVTTGGVLSEGSTNLLNTISARHPKWQPSPGDKDDFGVWHESHTGAQGHPELLARVPDDALVNEAMRLQRERQFEEGDVWRVLCSADPERALRGLRHDEDRSEWNVDAWRPLLWVASEKGEPEFQFDLANLLLRMPDRPLGELLPAAASWLQRRREVLATTDRPSGPRFLPLWDRFARLTYAEATPAESGAEVDLDQRSLNEPGGVLAWSLLNALSTPKPQAGSGLGGELLPRFERVLNARGTQGLLGRFFLVRELAYLDAIDPKWVEARLQPLLTSGDAESLMLWRSYCHGQIGSPRLFNATKPALLKAFERHRLSDQEYEGLVGQLLSVGGSHLAGEALEYNLPPAEIKQALTVGPSAVRRHASRNFWEMAGEEEGQPRDKSARWRAVIGPLFRSVWPLDAGLRSPDTTRNLVYMALECEGAFPDAVEAIHDLIVPYHLYSIAQSLRLEQHHDRLARDFPVAFLKLVNALIDPSLYPLPADLAALLRQYSEAYPAVVEQPSYIRLFGLRRQQGG
jgi:hypothetical protein